MKTFNPSATNVWRKALVGLALIACGPAMAAQYNILLKGTDGAGIGCAPGGFTFIKTTAGPFTPTAASITLTGCPSSFVPAIANGTYVPGTLQVIVENVTFDKTGTGGRIETLNQGPNVEGLTGTLSFTTSAPGTCQGTGVGNGNGNGNNNRPKTYTLTFAYAGGQTPTDRTYTLSCTGLGTFTRSGRYHVQNVANVVPEPQTLGLVVAALGALVLARRLRRRS